MGKLFVLRSSFLAFFTVISLFYGDGGALAAAIPEGYPQNYANLVRKAEDEGSFIVYGNTENIAVAPLLEDFRKAFPKIRIDYIEIRSADLYSRVSSEVAANALRTDVI